MTEYAPAKVRATRVGIMFIGYTVCSARGGLIAARLIPAYGWSSVFVVGGILRIGIGLLSLFVLPESVRFLMLRRGRADLVLPLLRRVRPDLALADDASFTLAEEHQPGLPVKRLFVGARGASNMPAKPRNCSARIIGPMVSRAIGRRSRRFCATLTNKASAIVC